MTRFRLFACGALALAIGCKKDATFTEPLPNYAHVNFLNALSDTMQLDTRIVDIVSSFSGFMDADFRGGQLFPLNIDPGDRHLKVFLSSTVDTIASKVLIDTSLTFAEGQDYTLYLAGRAGGGGPPARAIMTNVAQAAPGAGKFALRVMNLAPSLAGTLVTIPDTAAAPDAVVLSGPDAITATSPVTASAVAFATSSQYTVLDTSSFYKLALTPPGAPASASVLANIPAGSLASGGSSAVGGAAVSGSVITAVIVPRSVPGTRAPQTRTQGALQITDTSVSEASRRITRSNDTVTVQVGSLTMLTNRRSATGARLADTTIGRTGTGGAAPSVVTRGASIIVTGATQPEYNGWWGVLSTLSTFSCAVADPGDVLTGASPHCAPPADTTVASADTATTRWFFRYRISGAPATPGSGNVQYRVAPVGYGASDFATPQIIFMIDKRP